MKIKKSLASKLAGKTFEEKKKILKIKKDITSITLKSISEDEYEVTIE